MGRLILAAVLGFAGLGTAVAGPLEDCMASSEAQPAARACLDMRARAASGDLDAAVEAATSAAVELAEVTGRDAALRTLIASERAFVVYEERECRRRGAVMDAGTGAGAVELACHAELRSARAAQLWGENGGVPAIDLPADREWRLVEIESLPVLEGTAPTLAFEDAERVGGDASTNRFFAPYYREGLGIAFGLAGSTMMFNDEPPGRMAQEQRYLALLGEVDRLRRDGDRLELLAAGRPVLVFE